MKVLRVIASMDKVSGGPPQGIRNSVPALEALGVYNEVVTLDDPADPTSSDDFFPIHRLGPAVTPWNYSKKLLPWLIKNLNRFDAVVVHGLWLYPGYAVWRSKQILKKRHKLESQLEKSIPKIFVMPHGMLDPYFQNSPKRRLKAIRNKLYWKFIENKLINGAEGVFFTCEEELRLARRPFRPYFPKRESTVGYGIKEPPFYTSAMQEAFADYCPNVNRPYLLYLSRIHSKKGVDLLINAYETMLNNYGKDRVPSLVIAGPGIKSAYGQKLYQLTIGDSKLAESIFFPGMLTGDAKWGAFYGCEAFVLPSHQENFGIAVVEALACSAPVLISNKINIYREIEMAEAGLIQEDNLPGVEILLETWVNLPKTQKQTMKRNAYNLYQSLFKIGPAAARFKEALLKSL